MAPITLEMIRRRAEHNEGMVSTLEEISLHQQEIERIEALGQICRHLKILYMQNNLVSKLNNLHRLKELEYANFAVNNIRKIENLQRCESLTKLDLTMNFVEKASLLTVHTLRENYALEDLYLMGNPCADFGGYRPFVIGTLPQLKRLDGKEVTPSERIVASQALPEVTERLLRELRAAGVDVEEARRVKDARDLAPDEEDIAEILEMSEDERPWCPATRVAEQRESARLRDDREAKKKENIDKLFAGDGGRRQKPRRDGFPDLPDDVESVRQCNEGDFEFVLTEDAGEHGDAVELEIKVGKYVDASLMDVDVRPRLARALVKGRMLCLSLPAEVLPDASTAQRSRITGSLVVTMPKARTRDARSKGAVGVHGSGRGSDGVVGPARRARFRRAAGSAAVPGWAAIGTGSEDWERDRRRRESWTARRTVERTVGDSSPNGALGARGALDRSVVDTDRAVGGASGAAARAKAPTGPAAAAKQHAVYGDDSDDEPPPL